MRFETLGDCTIYLGDSRELIPMLECVDVTITDPPYGVNYNGSVTKHSNIVGGYTSFDDTRENIIALIRPIVDLCLEKVPRLCMTPGRASMFL